MVPPPLPPPPLPPPLCTLPPGPGPPRFICCCEEEKAAGASGQGGLSLYVTDAAELWSTCFTPDGLAALKARFGLSAAEDVTSRFRAAFKQQAVTFTPQEDAASLTLSGGPATLDFQLSKVPGPEAAPRLQALTLGLAERVCSLERQLACRTGGWAPAASPGPPAHAFTPGFSRSCGGDGHQPQEEPEARGASAVPTRSRRSERLPWPWGQEAVSWRVPHQPWLQK